MLSILRRLLFPVMFYVDPPAPAAAPAAPAAAAPAAPAAAPAAPPAGGGGAPAAAATPPAAPGGGAAPAGGSVLGDGKPKAGEPGGAPAEPLEKRVAEKYRVYDGEGDAKKFNLEKTLEKVAGAHTELETRMGTMGGARPEKPADYKLEFKFKGPDGKELEAKDHFAGASLEGFQKEAWELGLNQKQFEGAMQAHQRGVDEIIGALLDRSKSLCQTELKAVWQAPGEYDKNLNLAYRAFASFADADEMRQIDMIGNNATMLRILARIGGHLGEANLALGPGVGAVIVDDNKVAEYLKPGSAYWDKNHAEHKTAVAYMNAHFNKAHGSRPAMVGVIGNPSAAPAAKR